MPEGDTIYRAATNLRPAMEGGTIEHAQIRDRQFEVHHIIGRTVTAVEARGKHLLMHLREGEAPAEPQVPDPAPLSPVLWGEGLGVRGASQEWLDRSLALPPASRGVPAPGAPQASVLHSHMGMNGSWHIYHPGQPWLKPKNYASLELSINNLVVVCFSPKQLELLTADQFRRHPHIQRLGPDLCAKEFDMPAAVARFRRHNTLPLGEAVMNQTLVCGIGNVYKSEVLFLMHLDPFAPVAFFSDEELTAMLAKSRQLLLRNLANPVRTTRVGAAGAPLWIYGKSGRPCPKCGAVIQLRRQGDAGRTTCRCPACQPPREKLP